MMPNRRVLIAARTPSSAGFAAQTVDVVPTDHVGPGCRDPDVAFNVDYRVPIRLAAFGIVADRTSLVLQPDQRGDYS